PHPMARSESSFNRSPLVSLLSNLVCQGKRSRRKGFARRPALVQRLSVEHLEERTLLSVNPTLTNGTLDIALTANNDQATIDNNGASIRVIDGANKETDFSVLAVHAINAHGSPVLGRNLLNQSVSFTHVLPSAITQSIVLTVADLSTATIAGNHQVQS